MEFQDEPVVVGADRDQVSMLQDIFSCPSVKPSYYATSMLRICDSFERTSMLRYCDSFERVTDCLAILVGRERKTSAYDSIMIMSTDEADVMDTALKIDGLGLQVLKDGKWVDAKSHPGAFVIKKGNQLQVITYGASAKDIKKILCAVLSALKEKNSYLGWGPFGTLDPLPGEPSGSNFGGIIFCAPVSGSSSTSSRVWILDTGATDHVCSSPSSFQYLDLSVNPVVTVANGQTVSAAGIGSVRLSDHLTLENVLFVPEFHLNVVSVSALTEQHRYTAIFTSDYYVILDLSRGQIILLGRRSGNLYVLN